MPEKAMRQIPGYSLWIGNATDLRAVSRLLEAGIEAVVALAIEELPATIVRELVYCRLSPAKVDLRGAVSPSSVYGSAAEGKANGDCFDGLGDCPYSSQSLFCDRPQARNISRHHSFISRASRLPAKRVPPKA